MVVGRVLAYLFEAFCDRYLLVDKYGDRWPCEGPGRGFFRSPEIH